MGTAAGAPCLRAPRGTMRHARATRSTWTPPCGPSRPRRCRCASRIMFHSRLSRLPSCRRSARSPGQMAMSSRRCGPARRRCRTTRSTLHFAVRDIPATAKVLRRHRTGADARRQRQSARCLPSRQALEGARRHGTMVVGPAGQPAQRGDHPAFSGGDGRLATSQPWPDSHLPPETRENRHPPCPQKAVAHEKFWSETRTRTLVEHRLRQQLLQQAILLLQR